MHTATEPGDAVRFGDSLSDAGEVLVDRFDALVETTAFFVNFQRPVRPNPGGLAILSGTGGGAM